MIILGLIVVVYLISLVLFSMLIFFLILSFWVKFSNNFEELGVDRIFILNPFFFPVNKIRNIAEGKKIENKKKLLKYLSVIKFYKFYAIIGVIICIPCIYILANSKMGLK